MTSRSYSTHENSDDISELNENDINDNDSEKISSEAKSNYITTEFKEKVKRFLYIDDKIRSKHEQIKELKNLKKPCEEFIIKYLEQEEENIVNAPGGKLVKNESSTKAPIKMDIIKESIIEKSKNEKIFDTEEKYNRFLEAILELMDKKRPIKKRVNLKRIIPREKKIGTKKINDKINDKNNDKKGSKTGEKN